MIQKKRSPCIYTYFEPLERRHEKLLYLGEKVGAKHFEIEIIPLFQVKREVTKRSISVDNLTKTQRKKYPMTATRRRIPSSNSTTTEASSSVFELNDHSSTPRADLYNYRSRRRVDSLSNYPSDTESTCSSRIPRYYGSRKKELSDNDVKQIVNLVKTGERKLSGSLSSEIIIKKDPLSQRWELSSAPPKRFKSLYLILESLIPHFIDGILVRNVDYSTHSLLLKSAKSFGKTLR